MQYGQPPTEQPQQWGSTVQQPQPWAAPMPTQSAALSEAPPPSVPPQTHTIPYADPPASVVSVAASRAMGAPPSLAMGAPPSLAPGVPPSLAPGAPPSFPMGGLSAPLDPAATLERVRRAREVVERTRSSATERYTTLGEAHASRQEVLNRTVSVAAEMPEADPPPGWTPAPAPVEPALQQPEALPAELTGMEPEKPAFFGAPSAADGSVTGATSMGVSRETGPGMAGAGTADWMNWVGKPKKQLKGVAKAGDRTDDQWLKVQNGVLRFFKDPYHNTVRAQCSVLRA